MFRQILTGALSAVLMAAAVVCGIEEDAPLADAVVSVAQEQLGKPYAYSAAGEDCFDCSGLVQFCFGKAGIELPRTARDIGYDERFPRVENIEDLQKGDIVCFDTVADGDLSDHVGICLGDNQVLHASSGQRKVVVSELTGYFEETFSWGLRLLD